MPYIEVIMNARISKVWRITSKYLKLARIKYKDQEPCKYDKLAFLIIDFYRKVEYRIKEENLSLLKYNFESELKKMLQEEQEEI
jgi:hypothetical protein